MKKKKYPVLWWEHPMAIILVIIEIIVFYGFALIGYIFQPCLLYTSRCV